MRRLGVVGIVIEDRERQAPKVNEILSACSDVIVGRMGLPYKERGVSVIALIVDGTNDRIGALTGKLGMIEGVKVRYALSKEK